MPADGIPSGIWWGQVPEWVLKCCNLSIRARWLYALFCCYSDRDTNVFWYSLAGLAALEDVSVRTIQNAVRELEEWGLVEKSGRRGPYHYFVLTRDPKRVPAVKSRSAPRLEKRREQFGEFGRKGAAVRASRTAQAKANIEESSPLGENVFVPDEKDSPPRTDIVEQSFVNRAQRPGRKRRRREWLSKDEQHAGKSTAPPKHETRSDTDQSSTRPFSTDPNREQRGDIDWNGWMDVLAEFLSRTEATLCIYGAIDRLRETLGLDSE